MTVETGTKSAIAKNGTAAPHVWIWLVVTVALVGGAIVFFFDGIVPMVESWSQEEYSNGYLIPLITLWLIWRKKDELLANGLTGSWLGLGLVVLGLLLGVAGELATVYTVIQYAFILTLFGIAWTAAGGRNMRILWPALLYLAFMVPLPNFLYQNLATKMQLISSELGVAIIRLFGVSVFLEGNVIDLGGYQLQVVEACSGLRYLFPLAGFSYLCAYLFRGPWWQKLLVFLSAAPITIVINSIRIGITGVLVDRLGIEQAEGFLHLFEGWVIFLLGLVLLFALMIGLARLTGQKDALRELLGLDQLDKKKEGALGLHRAVSVPKPYWAALILLTITAIGNGFVPARAEIIPDRRPLATFPMAIGPWMGREQGMEQQYIDTLKFRDYLLADFHRPWDAAPVNFYVAYYDSQRKGASVHSPRSCIPGGGWEISDLGQLTLPNVGRDGAPLPVNRAIIAKGSNKQLVYYWFDQRGRHITNEYVVKAMLFWDALTKNRTDGALVRVVTPIVDGEPTADADRRLTEFLASAYPQLAAYVPN